MAAMHSKLEEALQDRAVSIFLPLLATVTVLIANFLIFVVAPDERVMGAVQRMLYFHVGAVMATYLMIAIILIGSLSYLATRTAIWDRYASAASTVGFFFCSAVLASGMIWGHASWNTWWRWEPRLTSFLVLWLLFLGYEVLRVFTERDDRQSIFASVLGVLLAVNVPVVIYSIKLWSHTEQLHPEVVANQGLRDARYVYALVSGIVAMLIVAAWFWATRVYQLRIEERLQEIAAE